MTDPLPDRLFAYGTLVFESLFAAITGHSRVSAEAELADHAAYRVHEAPYPGMIPKAGARAAGVLYRDIDPQIWARLDAFEDAIYFRQSVTITLASGQREAAQTYIVYPQYAELLSDENWDPAWFVENHLARYLQRFK
ncbi:MAG: gamma-glutamylcyclotransferase family protein [Pseudomonadota bacterium]